MGARSGVERRVISMYPLPQIGMGMRGMRRSYREGEKVLCARGGFSANVFKNTKLAHDVCYDKSHGV